MRYRIELLFAPSDAEPMSLLVDCHLTSLAYMSRIVCQKRGHVPFDDASGMNITRHTYSSVACTPGSEPLLLILVVLQLDETVVRT